jgi:hypothetical protein
MIAIARAIVCAAAVFLPSLAHAQSPPTDYVKIDVALDLNGNGTMDRAVLSGGDGRIGNKDLAIYLDAGTEAIDASRKPSFVKKGLADGIIATLEVRGSSLRVQFGCGGCSNDYETLLTIAFRRGEFWVVGYTYEWETRDFGAGTCDINLATGKGTLSKDGGKARAVRGRFAPVKLADWDEDKAPFRACGFKG